MPPSADANMGSDFLLISRQMTYDCSIGSPASMITQPSGDSVTFKNTIIVIRRHDECCRIAAYGDDGDNVQGCAKLLPLASPSFRLAKISCVMAVVNHALTVIHQDVFMALICARHADISAMRPGDGFIRRLLAIAGLDDGILCRRRGSQMGSINKPPSSIS